MAEPAGPLPKIRTSQVSSYISPSVPAKRDDNLLSFEWTSAAVCNEAGLLRLLFGATKAWHAASKQQLVGRMSEALIPTNGLTESIQPKESIDYIGCDVDDDTNLNLLLPRTTCHLVVQLVIGLDRIECGKSHSVCPAVQRSDNRGSPKSFVTGEWGPSTSTRYVRTSLGSCIWAQ